MDMVVQKLRTFQESCGLMVQSHYCNPHDSRMRGKCLSVCVSVCIQPVSTSCMGNYYVHTAGYRLDFFFRGA